MAWALPSRSSVQAAKMASRSSSRAFRQGQPRGDRRDQEASTARVSLGSSDTLTPDTTPVDRLPVGYEVLAEEIEDRRSGEVFERRQFVKMIPEATGEIVEDAFASQTPSWWFPDQSGHDR